MATLAVGVRANQPGPLVRVGALLVSLIATLATTTLPLSAQSASTGGLRGRILDRDSVPVEAALVTLTHTPTGTASTALSVADGRYTLRGQRPGGPYRVTVARLGFRDFTREDIELRLGQFVDLDVTLVSQAIEVEPLVVEVEPDPEFNPGRIGISTLVTSDVLTELPTLTRNFLDFAALSPWCAPPRRACRWRAPAIASTASTSTAPSTRMSSDYPPTTSRADAPGPGSFRSRPSSSSRWRSRPSTSASRGSPAAP